MRAQIGANLGWVEERINNACALAGRARAEVSLVAVTKTFGLEHIRAAEALGISRFGENRVQEGVAKIAQLGEGSSWHLIGRLQKNKARDATAFFNLIESVDSTALARAIDRRAPAPNFPVLLQVFLSEAAGQGGIAAEGLADLCGQICESTSLRICGLMSIAPQTDDQKILHETFATLRQLRERLKTQFPNQPLGELSMGMTSDFPAAIAEGSTIVRIGRAIFGTRPNS